jgi:hypothetical protein
MAAMGLYDEIKKAFHDLIAPELHQIRGDLHRLEQRVDGVNTNLTTKIDGADARLNLKIDGLRGETASMKAEVLAEIRRVDARIDGVDTRIDAVDRHLQTAIEIRERLAALEARRPA